MTRGAVTPEKPTLLLLPPEVEAGLAQVQPVSSRAKVTNRKQVHGSQGLRGGKGGE